MEIQFNTNDLGDDKMFGTKRKFENRHVVAVKYYDSFIKSAKEGSIYLPYDKDIYLDFLENDTIKLDNIKGLKKFAKKCNKKKSEVKYYWEGLINQGYTIFSIKYDKKQPSIQNVCNNDSMKYICDIS